jgi:hypothetical protein
MNLPKEADLAMKGQFIFTWERAIKAWLIYRLHGFNKVIK